MMRVIVRLACVMALLLAVPACGLLFQWNRVDVPFQAGVKGAVAEAEFRAPLTQTYLFRLRLYHDPGNGDPRDPLRSRDRERVRKLAGSGVYDHRTMRQIDTGLPIPVRLTVSRLGVGVPEVILNQVYSEHDLVASGDDYFEKRVATARLVPGRYRVRIEALEDLPALTNVPVRFHMYVPSYLR